MFVFRNTLGFYQHKRLLSPVGDIDFTGNDGGVTPPPSNPQDSPDINGGKGKDINDNDNPDKIRIKIILMVTQNLQLMVEKEKMEKITTLLRGSLKKELTSN